MNLEEMKCANEKCKATFKMWPVKPNKKYYCSEFCYNTDHSGRTFWGAEDRRLTAIKKAKEAQDIKNEV